MDGLASQFIAAASPRASTESVVSEKPHTMDTAAMATGYQKIYNLLLLISKYVRHDCHLVLVDVLHSTSLPSLSSLLQRKDPAERGSIYNSLLVQTAAIVGTTSEQSSLADVNASVGAVEAVGQWGVHCMHQTWCGKRSPLPALPRAKLRQKVVLYRTCRSVCTKKSILYKQGNE